jgi:mannose-6-phosphate isomerase-like protein (cupin superfamily)
MRAIAITLALAGMAGVVCAQQPAAGQAQTYASAADVAALLAKAKAGRKQNQPLVAERILALAPYNLNLEYRTAVGPAAVHEREAELFYVLDGSGTLVTGGKLVNEKRTNAENLQGTGIEGGKTQAVAKGDVLIVPENTPHWFSAIHGNLVLMSLHVPRPVAAH